jgi:3-oxocholest-4-en-26-oate---CoA ligase
VSTSGSAEETARFALGENVGVFTDDGRRVEPGSPEPGLVAVSGFIPVGYYKDEAKTAQTFRTFDGRRWSVPGDWAEVRPDGSLHLLGRGSVCINTGGEKVFPEEVEAALKSHAEVFDAIVVGVPDERWGEHVCAVVAPRPGCSPTLEQLAEHGRQAIAGYKVPRQLVLVDEVQRTPAGKPDYRWAKATALEACR